MPPKVKPKGPKSQGIDLTDLFFDNGKEAGVWETAKDKGISTAKIVDMIKAGHKVYRRVVKRPEGNRFEWLVWKRRGYACQRSGRKSYCD